MDYSKFIHVGRHIEDRIYEVPKEDLDWFDKVKKTVEQNEDLRSNLRGIILHLENLSVYQDPRVNDLHLIPLLNKLRVIQDEN